MRFNAFVPPPNDQLVKNAVFEFSLVFSSENLLQFAGRFLYAKLLGTQSTFVLAIVSFKTAF